MTRHGILELVLHACHDLLCLCRTDHLQRLKGAESGQGGNGKYIAHRITKYFTPIALCVVFSYFVVQIATGTPNYNEIMFAAVMWVQCGYILTPAKRKPTQKWFWMGSLYMLNLQRYKYNTNNPIYLHIPKYVCTFNTNRYVNILTSQKRPKQMQWKRLTMHGECKKSLNLHYL